MTGLLLGVGLFMVTLSALYGVVVLGDALFHWLFGSWFGVDPEQRAARRRNTRRAR